MNWLFAPTDISLQRISAFVVASLLAASLFACADSRPQDSGNVGVDSAPALLPVDDTVVAVGETARIEIRADNPAGIALVWSVETPPLPGITSTTVIGGTPAAGELVYAPLASHVGVHDFAIRIESSRGSDEVIARVVVEPAGAAAPVFLRPGPGGTFDLTREPCVTFDIEVRDDDSTDVTLSLASAPEGAELQRVGPRSAQASWCPSPQQVATSDRYTFDLEADDGQHAATPHRFVAVLRLPQRDGCTGTPPEVSFLSPTKGELVASPRGYPVRIAAVDDLGLRDAPILYYTATAPENEDDPDITDFSQDFFERDGADWIARIPSLGLAPNEQRVVWLLATATDNDDASGTACDNTSTSEVLRFVAVGALPDDGAALCDRCDASSECASGRCVVLPTGRRCVTDCDVSCAVECSQSTSADGALISVCGAASTLCAAEVADCVDDRFEPNDDPGSPATIETGSLNAQVCDNADYYAVAVAEGDSVEVAIDGFRSEVGDLDLAVFAADGRLLDESAGVTDREEVAACAPANGELLLRVVGYDGAQNPYVLHVAVEPGNCCTNDAAEPDNSFATARPAPPGDLVEGIICPGDEDFLSFEITTASLIEFDLVFDAERIDLELDLYGPGGLLVASSRTLDEERIAAELREPGTYTFRVYGYTRADSGEYLGQLGVVAVDECSANTDCMNGEVCRSGDCVAAICRSSAECGGGAVCTASEIAPSERVCRSACSVNSDCGSDACKWYPEGRACGARGPGQNGDRCTGSAACGGQRVCLPWDGGYCARAGCATNTDCQPGTWCTDYFGDGETQCVLDCLATDDVCRLAEGYICDIVEDVSLELRFACVP